MSLIPAYFSVRVLLREKLVFELSQLKVHFLLRPTAIQPRLLTFPFGDVYSLRGANEQHPDLQLPTSTSTMRYFYIST